MKNLIWIALVSVLLIPGGVIAQATPSDGPDVVLPSEAIGDGWTITQQEEGAGYPSPWDQQIVYGGPEGARITVWTLKLGTGLEWVSGSWSRLTAFWGEQATQHTGINDPAASALFTEHVGAADSTSISDFKAVEGAGITVSQYGSYDHRFGVVVMVEGAVNGLTGVAATDFIAGLYFAALSAD